jgi:hypothetical protein
MRLNTKNVTCLGFLICLLVGTISPGYAVLADRPLPKDGVLGVFSPSKLPKIIIDDKEVKFAAGGQIRNQKNVIVQPVTLKAENKGEDVKILYEKDTLGDVKRIWMLTDAEVERVKAGNKAAPLPAIKASTPQTH